MATGQHLGGENVVKFVRSEMVVVVSVVVVAVVVALQLGTGLFWILKVTGRLVSFGDGWVVHEQ